MRNHPIPYRHSRECAREPPSTKENAGQRVLVVYRPEVARAKGLPEPANYQTHTTVRNPDEMFTYSFPDTNANVVSNGDGKFEGKVVLAIVTGTWCPAVRGGRLRRFSFSRYKAAN